MDIPIITEPILTGINVNLFTGSESQINLSAESGIEFVDESTTMNESYDQQMQDTRTRNRNL